MPQPICLNLATYNTYITNKYKNYYYFKIIFRNRFCFHVIALCIIEHIPKKVKYLQCKDVGGFEELVAVHHAMMICARRQG